MPDNSFKEVSLSDYAGKKYVCLFFYPLDFTFVCPTEIVAFNDAIAQFEARNVQILACSVDSKFAHLTWRNTPRDKAGIGNVMFPILADITKSVAEQYQVLMPDDGIALRGLFIIDKKGMLQHQQVNNLPIGRSVSPNAHFTIFTRVGGTFQVDILPLYCYVNGGRSHPLLCRPDYSLLTTVVNVSYR